MRSTLPPLRDGKGENARLRRVMDLHVGRVVRTWWMQVTFWARVCYIQYRFPCEYMRRNDVVEADDAQSAE